MDVYKLGRDEGLVAPHMHKDVLAISAQGRFQGEANIGPGGGGALLKTTSSDRKATATNQMHRNELEACGMKCSFWFHSEVIFWHANLAYNRSANCTQVSDQCPLGL